MSWGTSKVKIDCLGRSEVASIFSLSGLQRWQSFGQKGNRVQDRKDTLAFSPHTCDNTDWRLWCSLDHCRCPCCSGVTTWVYWVAANVRSGDRTV